MINIFYAESLSLYFFAMVGINTNGQSMFAPGCGMLVTVRADSGL